MTVLYADVVASSELVKGLNAEEARGVVGPLIDAMLHAVARYGGVVDRVEGDRVMAVFGASGTDEDHAIGACFAALDIPRLVSASSSDVQVRIGVHSGQVHVAGGQAGGTGSTVDDGPTVKLAARMEEAARPGIPLVTAATATFAAGNVRTGSARRLEVEGFDGTIEVYELMGKADASGRMHAETAGRLTPFIGRADELTKMRLMLESASDGNGTALSIVGDAGVGKTRLLYEFVQGLGDDVDVLSAHASPYDRSTPYRPIAEMMRSWLARRGGGAYNVEEVFESVDSSLVVYADAITALVGGDPSRAWVLTDAGLRRQTMRRAIRAILGASALESLTVLAFEDLHWMDTESMSVIDELADLAGGTPLMMITTSQSVAGAGWSKLDHARNLALGGLSGTEVTEFVDVLVGTRSSTAATRTELTDRNDGTPLFLEEMVRSLVDDHVLVGSSGKYKRGERDLRVQMPPDVTEVIEYRISRLADPERELLQLMSVHGEDVEHDLLRATTDRSERELADALSNLVVRELVFEDARARASRFGFKHNLIREVAYSTIPVKQRESLHARIAEGVMALEFEEDWTERLAHHTFEAGQWEDAARFALASARRAEAKSAYRESERFLTMSLDALALLPKNRSNIEQTIDALITRRISTVGIGGRIMDTFAGLDDAEALANEIGDLERVARVNLHRSYARSMTGHHTQGLIDADRAHGIGKQLGVRRLTAEANLAQAQHAVYAGKPATVGSLIGRDLTFMRDEIGRNGMMGHRAVWAHAHLAVANSLMGHFAAARQSAAEAVTFAKDRGLVLDIVGSLWAAATVELQNEGFKRAAVLTREAADLAAAHEFAWLGNLNDITRGYANSRLGNRDEGVSLLESSLQAGETMDVPMQIAWASVYLAEVTTALGENKPASEHARRALMLARKHGIAAAEVSALQMLGRSQHDLEKSRAFFMEALALSSQHSLRPLNAQIRAEAAWVVAELGNPGYGRQLATEANELRVEMGMSPIELPGLTD